MPSPEAQVQDSLAPLEQLTKSYRKVTSLLHEFDSFGGSIQVITRSQRLDLDFVGLKTLQHGLAQHIEEVLDQRSLQGNEPIITEKPPFRLRGCVYRAVNGLKKHYQE